MPKPKRAPSLEPLSGAAQAFYQLSQALNKAMLSMDFDGEIMRMRATITRQLEEEKITTIDGIQFTRKKSNAIKQAQP